MKTIGEVDLKITRLLSNLLNLSEATFGENEQKFEPFRKMVLTTVNSFRRETIQFLQEQAGRERTRDDGKPGRGKRTTDRENGF